MTVVVDNVQTVLGLLGEWCPQLNRIDAHYLIQTNFLRRGTSARRFGILELLANGASHFACDLQDLGTCLATG